MVSQQFGASQAPDRRLAWLVIVGATAYMALTSLIATACLVEVLGQFTIDDSTSSHEWMSRTAMPLKRSDMTATTVADAIYIIGGCSNDQEYSAGAGMYLGVASTACVQL